MFLVISLFVIGIGYAAYRMSLGLKHRMAWFVIFSGLLAIAAGFLFQALFLL